MFKFLVYSIGALTLSVATAVHAGPFAPAANQPGSTAVDMNDPGIAGWATGFLDYVPGGGVDPQFQTPNLALGPAAGNISDIVSLGNQGVITLTFGGTIFDGPGWDFAIFENGFSDTFLELARVEVSSDGSTFVPFPVFSLTPGPVNGFGAVDPTDIDGFAGKYKLGFGTPFDLNLFAASSIPNFDHNAVTHVRLVDIKGDGTEFDNWPANFGGPNPIYDPFPTALSAGFDLEAAAVQHLTAVPLPPAFVLLLPSILLLRARRRT